MQNITHIPVAVWYIILGWFVAYKKIQLQHHVTKKAAAQSFVSGSVTGVVTERQTVEGGQGVNAAASWSTGTSTQWSIHCKWWRAKLLRVNQTGLWDASHTKRWTQNMESPVCVQSGLRRTFVSTSPWTSFDYNTWTRPFIELKSACHHPGCTRPYEQHNPKDKQVLFCFLCTLFYITGSKSDNSSRHKITPHGLIDMTSFNQSCNVLFAHTC